jgi:hypothetical protein
VAEPQDQSAQRRFERRPTGSPLRVRPAASYQVTVPAQHRLRLDREARPGGERLSAASSARSGRSASAAVLADGTSQVHAAIPESQVPSSDAAAPAANEREHGLHGEIRKRPEQATLPRPRQQSTEPSQMPVAESGTSLRTLRGACAPCRHRRCQPSCQTKSRRRPTARHRGKSSRSLGSRALK